MRYLLDTNILVWTLGYPERLPDAAAEILADPDAEIWFSAVNIWEIGIKSARGRPDFDLNAHLARTTTLRLGFLELAVTGGPGRSGERSTTPPQGPLRSAPRRAGDHDGLDVAHQRCPGRRVPGPIRHVR